MRPQEYNPLLERTRTSSVVLRNALFSTFRRNFSLRTADTPRVSGKASWHIREDHILFTQDYSARVSEESSQGPMMLIRAQYELVLYTDSEYSEEFAKEYSERQLHMLTRPYFRELVANMTPRALIMVPPLPSQFVAPEEVIEFPAPRANEALAARDVESLPSRQDEGERI